MAQLRSTNVFGTMKVFALTDSLDKDTGALVVSGGVGIKKNLNVGGNATIKTISGNSTWSGNIIAISKGGTGLASTTARHALLGPTSAGAPTWRAITVADISDITSASTGITKVGTITTGVWKGTAIANDKLANSSITVGTTNISLGGSSTTLAGLTSVTSTSFVGALTGNASTATTLKTARAIALTGAVTGTADFDGSGGISITTTHTADPKITLTGDVSGSGTMTNLGSVSIDATVADDSHNHVIGNIDGLGTALGLKAPLASPALTGTPTAPTADDGTNTTQIATTAFVSTAVSNLVDSSPAALDTLNELAAALGNDPNFATTVANNIGTKANKTITISAGSGLTGGGTLEANRTISHADTSTQASVNNSGRTFIQDISVDGFGHITGITSATDADTYVGTVTSVGITVPTGLSITSGSPVTTSGTITIGLTSGYSIPTTEKQGQWDTAYTKAHNSGSDNQTISAGAGMNFTSSSGDVSIVLGKPTALTGTTTNAVSSTGHTHSISLKHSDLGSIGASDHHTRYSNAEAVSALAAANVYVKKSDISDNLTTDNANKVLSANQGRVLKDKQDTLKGTGWAGQTVKGNADDIAEKESIANVDILKGTGWAGQTVKGNYDSINIINSKYFSPSAVMGFAPRNLMDVFGTATVAETVQALRTYCNQNGPDNTHLDGFRKLRLGDYIDLPSLTMIADSVNPLVYPARTINNDYNRLRVEIVGFDDYYQVGNTAVPSQHHVTMMFKDVPTTAPFNETNITTGDYPGSMLFHWLHEQFESALITAINGGGATVVEPLAVDRIIGTVTDWGWVGSEKIFLPTSVNIFGTTGFSHTNYGTGTQTQFALFALNPNRKIKRNNNSRSSWWLAEPSANSSTAFCHATGDGVSSYSDASLTFGVVPAFLI